MMINKFLFAMVCILTLQISNSFGCNITLKDRYLIVGHGRLSENDLPLLLENNDCPSQTAMAILSGLSDYQGTLRTSSIISQLQIENVVIRPDKISIESTTDLIRNKLSSLPQDLFIKFERSSKLIRLIGLNSSSEAPIVKCESGCGIESQPLQINLSIVTSQGSTLLSDNLTFKKLFRTSILQAKSNIGNLERDQLVGKFEKTYIFSDRPEEYFTDEIKLGFYKLNKTMANGNHLKAIDLAPKQLITTGQMVKVIIAKGPLELTTKGVARKNGFYGDSIEVIASGSKSIISGQVEDNNLVRVIE